MRFNDIINNCSGNRILVKSGDMYTDVTNMNAVLYGVSSWAFDAFIRSGIINIKHIIDKNPTKIGSYVKLDGKYYQVESPDILKDLNPDENYICLFTKRWHDEICADVERIVNGGKFITATSDEVMHSYSSLSDMFDYDGYCCERLNRFSRQPYWMKDRISTIIKRLELDVRRYMPMSYIGDSKLNILLLSDSGNYMLSYRGNVRNCLNLNMNDGSSANSEELYYYIVNASPITLYSDREGFLVMEFCDGKIEYNEDTIMKVIDEIKKLHMTKCPTDIEIGHARTDVRSDLWHFYFNDNELHNPKLNRIVNIYEKVWENKYPLVISHNDVHRGNIVRKDEMIYLIDWDCVSMNDELTDICGFLRSCKVEVFNESNPAKYDNDAQELYNSIEKYIEYYYGRKCTTAELKLAYEDIFIFEMERLWFVKEQLNYMPEPLLSMILSHGEQFILQQIKEG